VTVHGPVRVRVTPGGRWMVCDLCEQTRFAPSDGAARAFLHAHDPEPDPAWLERVASARARAQAEVTRNG